MSQNDFFVAIQGILTKATEEGWSIDWTILNAEEAVAEWEEEMNPTNELDEND